MNHMKHMKMKCMKWMSDCKHLIVPCVIILGIIIALMVREPIDAHGGGWGWGVGAGVVGGALIGSAIANSDSGRSYDPYAQLNKEQNKLNKLQDRYARTTSERQQMSLQRQIDLQMSRIQDLQSRLNIGSQPRAGYPQPAGY